VPGYDELLGKGVHYAVKDPESFRGKKILIVGGGDSALDWALILKDRAERCVIAHRRDTFRAHEKSVELLHAAHEAGEVEIRTFHEVQEIIGNGCVERATMFDNRTNDETTMECDAVLTFLGFKPDLGPMTGWGLEIRKNRILVNALMETNLPGVYGAGDIVDYEGKLDLIATGFAEAAIAVNNAVHHVNPDARVNPGHSTNHEGLPGEVDACRNQRPRTSSSSAPDPPPGPPRSTPRARLNPVVYEGEPSREMIPGGSSCSRPRSRTTPASPRA
jgi:ferredoxin/flavodoxin---NADP+ reductase